MYDESQMEKEKLLKNKGKKQNIKIQIYDDNICKIDTNFNKSNLEDGESVISIINKKSNLFRNSNLQSSCSLKFSKSISNLNISPQSNKSSKFMQFKKIEKNLSNSELKGTFISSNRDSDLIYSKDSSQISISDVDTIYLKNVKSEYLKINRTASLSADFSNLSNIFINENSFDKEKEKDEKVRNVKKTDKVKENISKNTNFTHSDKKLDNNSKVIFPDIPIFNSIFLANSTISNIKLNSSSNNMDLYVKDGDKMKYKNSLNIAENDKQKLMNFINLNELQRSYSTRNKNSFFDRNYKNNINNSNISTISQLNINFNENSNYANNNFLTGNHNNLDSLSISKTNNNNTTSKIPNDTNILCKSEISNKSIFYSPSTICNYYQYSNEVTPSVNSNQKAQMNQKFIEIQPKRDLSIDMLECENEEKNENFAKIGANRPNGNIIINNINFYSNAAESFEISKSEINRNFEKNSNFSNAYFNKNNNFNNVTINNIARLNTSNLDNSNKYPSNSLLNDITSNDGSSLNFSLSKNSISNVSKSLINHNLIQSNNANGLNQENSNFNYTNLSNNTNTNKKTPMRVIKYNKDQLKSGEKTFRSSEKKSSSKNSINYDNFNINYEKFKSELNDYDNKFNQKENNSENKNNEDTIVVLKNLQIHQISLDGENFEENESFSAKKELNNIFSNIDINDNQIMCNTAKNRKNDNISNDTVMVRHLKFNFNMNRSENKKNTNIKNEKSFEKNFTLSCQENDMKNNDTIKGYNGEKINVKLNFDQNVADGMIEQIFDSKYISCTNKNQNNNPAIDNFFKFSKSNEKNLEKRFIENEKININHINTTSKKYSPNIEFEKLLFSNNSINQQPQDNMLSKLSIISEREKTDSERDSNRLNKHKSPFDSKDYQDKNLNIVENLPINAENLVEEQRKTRTNSLIIHDLDVEQDFGKHMTTNNILNIQNQNKNKTNIFIFKNKIENLNSLISDDTFNNSVVNFNNRTNNNTNSFDEDNILEQMKLPKEKFKNLDDYINIENNPENIYLKKSEKEILEENESLFFDKHNDKTFLYINMENKLLTDRSQMSIYEEEEKNKIGNFNNIPKKNENIILKERNFSNMNDRNDMYLSISELYFENSQNVESLQKLVESNRNFNQKENNIITHFSPLVKNNNQEKNYENKDEILKMTSKSDNLKIFQSSKENKSKEFGKNMKMSKTFSNFRRNVNLHIDTNFENENSSYPNNSNEKENIFDLISYRNYENLEENWKNTSQKNKIIDNLNKNINKLNSFDKDIDGEKYDGYKISQEKNTLEDAIEKKIKKRSYESDEKSPFTIAQLPSYENFSSNISKNDNISKITTNYTKTNAEQRNSKQITDFSNNKIYGQDFINKINLKFTNFFNDQEKFENFNIKSMKNSRNINQEDNNIEISLVYCNTDFPIHNQVLNTPDGEKSEIINAFYKILKENKKIRDKKLKEKKRQKNLFFLRQYSKKISLYSNNQMQYNPVQKNFKNLKFDFMNKHKSIEKPKRLPSKSDASLSEAGNKKRRTRIKAFSCTNIEEMTKKRGEMYDIPEFSDENNSDSKISKLNNEKSITKDNMRKKPKFTHNKNNRKIEIMYECEIDSNLSNLDEKMKAANQYNCFKENYFVEKNSFISEDEKQLQVSQSQNKRIDLEKDPNFLKLNLNNSNVNYSNNYDSKIYLNSKSLNQFSNENYKRNLQINEINFKNRFAKKLSRKILSPRDRIKVLQSTKKALHSNSIFKKLIHDSNLIYKSRNETCENFSISTARLKQVLTKNEFSSIYNICQNIPFSNFIMSNLNMNKVRINITNSRIYKKNISKILKSPKKKIKIKDFIGNLNDKNEKNTNEKNTFLNISPFVKVDETDMFNNSDNTFKNIFLKNSNPKSFNFETTKTNKYSENNEKYLEKEKNLSKKKISNIVSYFSLEINDNEENKDRIKTIQDRQIYNDDILEKYQLKNPNLENLCYHTEKKDFLYRIQNNDIETKKNLIEKKIAGREMYTKDPNFMNNFNKYLTNEEESIKILEDEKNNIISNFSKYSKKNSHQEKEIKINTEFNDSCYDEKKNPLFLFTSDSMNPKDPSKQKKNKIKMNNFPFKLQKNKQNSDNNEILDIDVSEIINHNHLNNFFNYKKYIQKEQDRDIFSLSKKDSNMANINNDSNKHTNNYKIGKELNLVKNISAPLNVHSNKSKIQFINSAPKLKFEYVNNNINFLNVKVEPSTKLITLNGDEDDCLDNSN